MKREIFIVVPAIIPTGPVKGAFALANALAAQRQVTVVALKFGDGAEAPLDPAVRQIFLADVQGGFRGKIAAYRALLDSAGGRGNAASISMCLSADALNSMMRKHAVTCCSVRANMIENYRTDYGMSGIPVAVSHLLALRRFDAVAVMTEAMARQVRRYSRVNARIIGNFIDEAAIKPYRHRKIETGPLRFVFLGQLAKRKEPLSAVRALKALRDVGCDAILDMIGDGPLRDAVADEIIRLGMGKYVTLRGFMKQPYELLACADAMVLPSMSEGISRAALEALYLGVPCVLRAIDGNSELIRPKRNGSLFRESSELAQAMRDAAETSRQRKVRESLLPAGFRQARCADAYLGLAEEVL